MTCTQRASTAQASDVASDSAQQVQRLSEYSWDRRALPSRLAFARLELGAALGFALLRRELHVSDEQLGLVVPLDVELAAQGHEAREGERSLARRYDGARLCRRGGRRVWCGGRCGWRRGRRVWRRGRRVRRGDRLQTRILSPSARV
eukprot:6175545-Pleurochrysis_carterae.AAC.2